MSKIVFALFALFALTSAASLRSSVADLAMAASSNGQVALTQVPGVGYTLPVDLTRNARMSQQMLLSLYNSNVLFSKGCLSFKSYSCNQFDFCSVDNSKEVQTNYPYFTAKGNLAKTQLYADYSSWVLANDAPTFIATNCASQNTAFTGANTLGVLGLGFEGAAQKNYQGAVRSFAIFQDNTGFKLAFNPNVNNPRLRLLSSVQTTPNWRVPNVNSLKFSTIDKPLAGINLMWDINAETLAFPTPLYTGFLTQYLPNFGIQCPSVYSRPICNYNGNADFLPNIELVVNGQSILITPKMYAIDRSAGRFTLNLKATSPQMAGENFVTAEYLNTIILGSKIMAPYYTHFDASQGRVNLFQIL